MVSPLDVELQEDAQTSVVKCKAFEKKFTWTIKNLSDFFITTDEGFIESKTISIDEISFSGRFKLLPYLKGHLGPFEHLLFSHCSQKPTKVEVFLDKLKLSSDGLRWSNIYKPGDVATALSFKDFYDEASDSHVFPITIKCVATWIEDCEMAAPAGPKDELVPGANVEKKDVLLTHAFGRIDSDSSYKTSDESPDSTASSSYCSSCGGGSPVESEKVGFDGDESALGAADSHSKVIDFMSRFKDQADEIDEQAMAKAIEAFVSYENFVDIIKVANEHRLEKITDLVVANFILKQDIGKLEATGQWKTLKADKEVYQDIANRVISKLTEKWSDHLKV